MSLSREGGNGADIETVLADRKIERVLHFTTNRGLLGVLASGELMSRTLLSSDEYLENICTFNSRRRYEACEYWSYVNLSITDINKRFFDIASNKWWKGSELFWVTIEFDPIVLTHDGVMFATTNMGYDQVVPVPGAAGLEAVFADEVHSGWGRVGRRNAHVDANVPTDSQAEALYPRAISTEHVTAVYAYTDEHAAIAEAMCGTVGHREIPFIVDPDIFQL